MSNEISSRIDKWLWSVRVFKTRSVAIEYIKKGRVYLDELPVEPSKEIHQNDIISVRKPPITFKFRVKGIPKNRVGAKLVPEYMENITPPEEMQKLDPNFAAFFGSRSRGTGRPTKKERRTIGSIIDSSYNPIDWDDIPNSD